MNKTWFKNGCALTAAVTAIGYGIFTGCSSSSSTTPDSGGGTTVDLSEYASLLGEDMVISSPTAQRTTTGSLNSRMVYVDGIEMFAAPDATDSAAEKKEVMEELLAETAPATCAIALTLQNAGRANCYGPSVSYTNHEFNNSSGSWPGGDLGIWVDSEASSGEACIAAQLNTEMKGMTSLVDMGQFIGAGIACIANKNSLTMPSAENTSTDLTSALSGVFTVDASALTVTSAAIARDADVGGNPVYITTLSGTAGTKTIDVRIKHIPTNSTGTTNRGKISVKVSKTGPDATDGVSLEYEKTTATTGKFLLKKINFNAAGQDPYVSVSNQTVDFGKAWNNNANYFTGSMDLSNYTGVFSYAWQAGNGDSHTRVFNAIISESGGTTTGTGFFGFEPTVQTGAGAISGMIRAWTGPDSTRTPVNKVQRQDMTLTSGKFVVSGTPNTVFDPVADCDASGAMAMSWDTTLSRNVSSTTENLSAIGEVATVIGTLPTAPTTVDKSNF